MERNSKINLKEISLNHNTLGRKKFISIRLKLVMIVKKNLCMG